MDLARDCLNAGALGGAVLHLEDGQERVYEHLWFTFPLGLYQDLFERVIGLSYWDYWWSLEHWVDPAGTPIRLDRLRMVEREWAVEAGPRWEEAPLWRGEQRSEQRRWWCGPSSRLESHCVRHSMRAPLS